MTHYLQESISIINDWLLFLNNRGQKSWKKNVNQEFHIQQNFP